MSDVEIHDVLRELAVEGYGVFSTNCQAPARNTEKDIHPLSRRCGGKGYWFFWFKVADRGCHPEQRLIENLPRESMLNLRPCTTTVYQLV